MNFWSPPPGPRSDELMLGRGRGGGEATGAGFGLSEKENVPVRVSWAVGIDSDLCTAGGVKGSGHWFSVSLWSRVSQHWPY